MVASSPLGHSRTFRQLSHFTCTTFCYFRVPEYPVIHTSHSLEAMPQSVPLRSAAYFHLSPTFVFSHTSFTNAMCSSFRVCIGPPGLQLSENTTLTFYLSQYSNEFRQILHFDKFERTLRSFRLLLLNQQAPCTPSGVYGCYSHNLFQHTSNFLEKLLHWLVIFFLHKLRGHSTALCANFITTQTRSPYRS